MVPTAAHAPLIPYPASLGLDLRSAAAPGDATPAIAEGRARPSGERLVVLVPDLESDAAELAAQIRALAAPRGLAVLLVAQSDNAHDLWATRRDLTTLAALVSAPPQVRVDTHATPTREWLKILQHVIAPGDMVVCSQSQSVATPWPWQRKPLAEVIRARFQVPVCELTEVSTVSQQRPSTLGARILSWAVPLGIIAAFAFFQIVIEAYTDGWVTTALLCGSALVEIIVLAL